MDELTFYRNVRQTDVAQFDLLPDRISSAVAEHSEHSVIEIKSRINTGTDRLELSNKLLPTAAVCTHVQFYPTGNGPDEVC
jgi:hypothetical protein